MQNKKDKKKKGQGEKQGKHREYKGHDLGVQMLLKQLEGPCASGAGSPLHLPATQHETF